MRRLRRTIELNDLANVQVEEVAAAEFDGEATFSVALTPGQGRFADLPYIPDGGDVIEGLKCPVVASTHLSPRRG